MILLQRFQEARETSFKRGSEFILENVDLLYYYFHRRDIKRSGSYIETPEWLRNKKATTNPKNMDDDNCFQYGIPVALNHKNIGRDPQRISKIKSFSTKYNWDGIEFPAGPKDWKKFEQIMRQLDLIYCMYPTILNKYVARTNQNITMSTKIK